MRSHKLPLFAGFWMFSRMTISGIFFSLAEGHGLLWEAAKEFDMLLPSVPES